MVLLSCLPIWTELVSHNIKCGSKNVAFSIRRPLLSVFPLWNFCSERKWGQSQLLAHRGPHQAAAANHIFQWSNTSTNPARPATWCPKMGRVMSITCNPVGICCSARFGANAVTETICLCYKIAGTPFPFLFNAVFIVPFPWLITCKRRRRLAFHIPVFMHILEHHITKGWWKHSNLKKTIKSSLKKKFYLQLF